MVVTKNAKGFTLVELMIVVAIIGVLAVTLLPVLNGAQERARDGGRTASLNNIGAALSTFNSDEGQFPTSAATTATTNETGKVRCLSSSSGATATDLAAMLKGGKAPTDPQANTKVGSAAASNCSEPGSYMYFPLTKGGIVKSSFFLAADMETYKKANYTYAPATAPTGAGGTADDFDTLITGKVGPLSTEATNKADSIYVIAN